MNAPPDAAKRPPVVVGITGSSGAALALRAVEVLGTLGIQSSRLDERLSDLSAGLLKMVDIARALMAEPRVLLLDEPTSGMNGVEIDLLHRALAGLRATSLTLLLIEHNLDFMFDICEEMTVLETGHVVARGDPYEVFEQENVIRAYMGDAANAASLPERPGESAAARPPVV